MAKVKQIEVGFGVSLAINPDPGAPWIKPEVRVVVELADGDDPNAVIQRAFEICEDHVAKEIDKYEAKLARG